MRESNSSKRVQRLLRCLGISQKELSKKSGVDDSIICRVIKGQSTLNEKNLIKIADATGASPSWILGYGSDDLMEKI
jgi:transcriptional regulator with XRE-family HTH domain